MDVFSTIKYYENEIHSTVDYIRQCLNQNDNEINIGTLYETPHFHKRLLTGIQWIGEKFTHSSLVSTNCNYFYTTYGSMQHITLYKTFLSLFGKRSNTISFGVFYGISNDYISLNGYNVFFEKKYNLQPHCTATSGAAFKLSFPPITIFRKKDKTFNAGKLIMSLECKIGPSVSIQWIKPLVRKCQNLYGIDFTSDDIEKNMQMFKINHWLCCTTLNIRYGFITIKIGGSYRYKSFKDVLTCKLVAYLFYPVRRQPLETNFYDKERAYNAVKAQKETTSLFYQIDNIPHCSIKQLLTDAARFVTEIGITANIKELSKFILQIRKK